MSPDVVGVTVAVPAPLPPEGETASHDASSDAVHCSVPVPVLAMAIVLAAGAGAPCSTENERLAGDVESTGASGLPAQVIGRDESACSSAGRALGRRPYLVDAALEPFRPHGVAADSQRAVADRDAAQDGTVATWVPLTNSRRVAPSNVAARCVQVCG